MDGSLRVGRRGATTRYGSNHVGKEHPRLAESKAWDGRFHLVDPLATAQKLGIDRTDLVEHLLQLAIIAEELGDLGVGCIRHVTKPRAFAGLPDCGQISLGAVPRSVDAVAVRPTATLVGLDQ